MNRYIIAIPRLNTIGIHHEGARSIVNEIVRLKERLLDMQLELYRLQKDFSANVQGGPQPLYSEFISNLTAQILHLQRNVEDEIVALQRFLAYMSGEAVSDLLVCRDESSIGLGTAGYHLIREMKMNLEDAHRLREKLNSQPAVDLWSLLFPMVSSYRSLEAIGARSSGLIDFYNAVKTGGDWDYKSDEENFTRYYGNNPIDLVEGDAIARDHFGNIHFGFIGRAASFDRELLLMGAGGYQALSDSGLMEEPSRLPQVWSTIENRGPEELFKEWSSSYFDDPRDQDAIRMGMDLYDRYGEDFTDEEFLQLYREYADRLHK